MGKFRKKPAVIEAVRYEGHGNFNGSDVPDWIFEAFETGLLQSTNGDDPLLLRLNHAVKQWVNPGEYIAKDDNGKLYCLSPTEFATEYEPVE